MADPVRPRRPSRDDVTQIGPLDPFWQREMRPAEREQELRLNAPGWRLNPELVPLENPPEEAAGTELVEAGPSHSVREDLPVLHQHPDLQSLLEGSDVVEHFPLHPEAQVAPAAGPLQATGSEAPVLRHLHDHLLMRLEQLREQAVPRHPGVDPMGKIQPYVAIRTQAQRLLLPTLHRQQRRSAVRELARLRYVELAWRVWLMHGVVPPADLGEPPFEFRDDRAPALHLVCLEIIAQGGIMAPLPILQLGHLPSLREARFEVVVAQLQRRGRPPLCVRWLRAISGQGCTAGRELTFDTNESSQ